MALTAFETLGLCSGGYIALREYLRCSSDLSADRLCDETYMGLVLIDILELRDIFSTSSFFAEPTWFSLSELAEPTDNPELSFL
jgi:hypothetical protein